MESARHSPPMEEDHEGGLHCDSSNTVSAVPKTNITFPTNRWIPWHHDQICLYKDVKNNQNIPCFELWFREVGSLPSPSDDVKANSHGEVEGRRR